MLIDITGKKYGRWLVISCASRGERIHWNCVCDCGQKAVVASYSLRKGISKSCGCWQSEQSSTWMKNAHVNHRMCKTSAGANRLWRQYKHGAASRGLEFSIPREAFDALTQKSCYFCEQLPVPRGIRTRLGSFPHNGVDRLDNSLGYVLGNCVPCCGPCNDMKGTMCEQDFWKQVNRIATVCKKKFEESTNRS